MNTIRTAVLALVFGGIGFLMSFYITLRDDTEAQPPPTFVFLPGETTASIDPAVLRSASIEMPCSVSSVSMKNLDAFACLLKIDDREARVAVYAGETEVIVITAVIPEAVIGKKGRKMLTAEKKHL